MENKFFVPAVTFLSGLIVWIVLFVAHLMSDAVEALAPVAIVICLLVAGLIVFSALMCRKVGGPKIGGTVRASVLVVFALLTLWKIGPIAAAVLFIAAAIIVIGGRGMVDSEG